MSCPQQTDQIQFWSHFRTRQYYAYHYYNNTFLNLKWSPKMTLTLCITNTVSYELTSALYSHLTRKSAQVSQRQTAHHHSQNSYLETALDETSSRDLNTAKNWCLSSKRKISAQLFRWNCWKWQLAKGKDHRVRLFVDPSLREASVAHLINSQKGHSELQMAKSKSPASEEAGLFDFLSRSSILKKISVDRPW